MISLKDKSVLIVGLGISGYTAAKLLAKEGAKVKVTETAGREAVKPYLEKLAPYKIQFELNGHTEDFCKDIDLVITSPGVSSTSLPLEFTKRNNIPVIGELELGYQFCHAPIIAITGTNGKSTVTKLIGHILSSSGRHAVVCGNVGNPLSGEVYSITEKSIAVVEVSSFQLETIIDFKPYIAILLNVTEDHYERHQTLAKYKKEKFRIFENQSKSDWAILHSDFCNDALLEGIKSQILFFNGNMLEKEIALNEKENPLKGMHNLDNIMCSVMACRIMGLSKDFILEGIKTFKPLNHRYQTIASFNGIEFIDDSKATNIDATRRALESINKKVILIAGGRDKGGDYSSILPLVKEKVKAMMLIGEAAEKIKAVFSDTVPLFLARDMDEAVEKALSLAGKGESVMLSPMCSSFDMFTDYKHRGKVFQEAVKRLVNEAS